MNPPVFLAAIGDANSRITWSGTPYHFLQAGKARGLLDEGLPLSAEGRKWQARRIAWNLARVARGDRYGGYQYSRSFLEKLWEPVRSRIRSGVVINCFQLFPPSIVEDRGIEKWFFIDQTLLQLFDYYGMRATIGRRIAADALEREREGYGSAAGVIAHSNWAAESVIAGYGVAADRVHVVVPGANIDPIEYARWEPEEEQRRAGGNDMERPLRFVFVGKYWQRKGLDRLLRAFALSRRSGLKATLRVIGCRRESLPLELRNVEGVEWMGFIDKRTEAKTFLQTIAECQVGCLLSRAEAGGIAFREYHALGLAVLGTDSGGAPEHMIRDASVVIPARATDEEIADELMMLEKDRPRVERLREVAWQRRSSTLWNDTVSRILEFWPHSRANADKRHIEDHRVSTATL